MQIINPATEELIAHLDEDNSTQIQTKFEKARQAQKSWAQFTLTDRIEVLRKFYELLAEYKQSLGEILTREMGKPLAQAYNEINGARGRIEFFLENSANYLNPETVWKEPGLEEKIAYESLGVIANISAWNYPYLVGVNVFVPGLIAGNAVLYKPSEFTTLTGLEIGKLLHQAGVPEEVFQVIIGGKEAGETLLSLPLDGYFFTGSYKTGKYIYEKVASKMVPCQLELGGKDPVYVLDSNENIPGIARGIADGAFYNNGQSCCSVERIYVHEKVYEDFVNAFTEEVKSYKIGNPEETGVYVGPLTRKEQISVLENQVQDALDKGAQLLTGGKALDRKGYYFAPTVLVNVNASMLVMREESFGPIIGIQKVSSDEEALALMQDTEYGLTTGVYTQDTARAEKLLAQLDSGSAYWNCCDRVSPRLPWSGRRHSGLGATLSHLGIRAFTKPKGYHLRNS
ncbi:aldehyde dehydrogenase family protein [Rapidithrix thailandica]|uniref:Aldehyde dehydrogenase family protein n=1 Tax=Rapidithrix thailandica TaxID=413964 RepID=A0AAW9S9C6_9BACT